MSVVDLINELSSGDMDKEEYINAHDRMLEEIDRIEDAVKNIEVMDLEDYRSAMRAKSTTTSLFCYAFNNRKDNYERVSEIDGILGDKIYKFSKDFRKIRDSGLRSVAKYLITCWDKYYYREDQEKMIKALSNEGKLRKDTYEGYDGHEKVNYFVIGLHYSVGDNVFKYDSNGRQNRQYKRSCAIQAFYINGRFYDTIKELENDRLDVPLIEDYYSKTSVRSDAKESARVYLSRKDKRVIRNKYTN